MKTFVSFKNFAVENGGIIEGEILQETEEQVLVRADFGFRVMDSWIYKLRVLETRTEMISNEIQ